MKLKDFFMELKKILPALALILTVVFAFAFRPAENKATFDCTYVFEYIGGGVDNPEAYDDQTGVFDFDICEGVATVCALCINNSNLVYTQTEANISQFDDITNLWVGKPKVDEALTSDLYDDINDALSQTDPPGIDNPYTGTRTGVIIYLKD